MIHLHSQVMPPDGGINQGAIKKLFGASSHPWSVFFREVFQNSNDARVSKSEPFDFEIEVGVLPDEATQLIKPTIEKLDQFPAWKGLSEYLASAEKHTLKVIDRNTSGLDGGVRLSEDKIRSNFADFFFRLGRDASRDSGGGAFGFGRNVFFQTSTTNSIFVYTRFLTELGIESRFMGMAAGEHYHDGNQNLTGRHWWGQRDEELPVVPFAGADADQLAETFGVRDALEDSTGTVIVVLGPHTEEIGNLASTLRACAEIYAWPHFLPINDNLDPSCRFRFVDNGVALDPIDPSDSKSPVNGFFLAASGTEQKLTQIHDIRLERNLGAKTVEKLKLPSDHKQIGRLTYVSIPKSLVKPSPPLHLDCGLVEESSIALFRDAKIIVKYLPVQSLDPQLKVFGYFEVDPVYFSTFREAENLTHDTWDSNLLGLSPGSTNPVKLSLGKIEDHFSPFSDMEGLGSRKGSGDAYVSDQVGKFLEGVLGGGAFLPPLDPPTGGGGGGGGGGPKRPSLVPVSRTVVSAKPDRATGEFRFKCSKREDNELFICEIRVHTALGNGELESRKDAPIGSVVPEILTIEDSAGLNLGNGFNFSQVDDGSEICVTVSYPRNSRVQVVVEVSKAEPAVPK